MRAPETSGLLFKFNVDANSASPHPAYCTLPLPESTRPGGHQHILPLQSVCLSER